jgi:hypothetical protein
VFSVRLPSTSSGKLLPNRATKSSGSQRIILLAYWQTGITLSFDVNYSFARYHSIGKITYCLHRLNVYNFTFRASRTHLSINRFKIRT